MAWQKTVYNRNLTLGCGLLLLIAIIGGLALIILAFRWNGQSTRYPDSTSLSSQVDYQSLPGYLTLKDAYLTADKVGDIHNWYVERFRLNMITEGIGPSGCYALYGSTLYLTVRRHMGVMICHTPAGRTIQVTRSILLE